MNIVKDSLYKMSNETLIPHIQLMKNIDSVNRDNINDRIFLKWLNRNRNII